jgi:PhoH-like ATPase
MVKIYVLDTNVLIHDPKSIFNFEENEVVIPIYVIEEIDKLKKDQSQLGASARIVARKIDKLREGGKLSEGVALENGGKLRVEIAGAVDTLPESLREDVMDNRILAVAKHLKESQKESEVILVTKDINMRIKSDSMGIEVEDYETDSVNIGELYSGVEELIIPDNIIDRYYDKGYIEVTDIGYNGKIYPNQFFDLVSTDNVKKQALGIYREDSRRIEKLIHSEEKIWGVKGRNREQKYALEILMDKNIKVVTLVGKAGTGKTLLALAAGLEQVVEKGIYKKMFVARPIMPMGRDIGFLPGSEKEKLRPWVQPIYDNFDFLAGNKGNDESEKIVAQLENKGLLKIEALTYIRGRSIPAGFMIIDEAQNLTPHEIKTIVTRAGEETKIVFTGDPYQIDNPYLDANSNGLTYLAEKFKNETISGHVTLIKGERSRLAEIAAKLL